MRTKLSILLLACISFHFTFGQVSMSDSLHRLRDSTLRVKDSTFRAMYKSDSDKVEKDFAEKAKWENLDTKAIYPFTKEVKTAA